MAAPVIKVMIVDDSAVVRQVMSAVLAKDPQLQLMPSASDPIIALEKMALDWPDVIVLDVEMPRMDGITFLKKIMAERPTPVVICSTLTERGAETTMNALAAGAVCYVTKPKLGLKDFISESASELIRSVKLAANSRPRASTALQPHHAAPATATSGGTATASSAPQSGASALSAAKRAPGNLPGSAQPAAGEAAFASASGATNKTAPAPTAKTAPRPVLTCAEPASRPALTHTTDKVIAIGTSTGGTQALEVVLTALPRVTPGIVVVQHMPEKFTALFAARLNGLCQMEVKEAKHGDRVIPGRVLIAPGGMHMRLTMSGAQYLVDVLDGPPVNRHKPSVDVLFKSVAQLAGKNALGIIMTGMGDDGARGLREMHDAGSLTLAQDEATCVVYGMPKEAVKLGAVDQELPLERLAAEIAKFGK